MRKSRFLILIVLTTILSAFVVLEACQSSAYRQGEGLYNFYCANCHSEDGTGLKKLIPGLNDRSFLQQHQSDLPCWIKYGLNGPITVNGIDYNFIMEGFPQLEDAEVNNIVNYILTGFGNDLPPVSPLQIQQDLLKCEQ